MGMVSSSTEFSFRRHKEEQKSIRLLGGKFLCRTECAYQRHTFSSNVKQWKDLFIFALLFRYLDQVRCSIPVIQPRVLVQLCLHFFFLNDFLFFPFSQVGSYFTWFNIAACHQVLSHLKWMGVFPRLLKFHSLYCMILLSENKSLHLGNEV